MSYEKGTFAFFDGTSSEYQKVLKLTDSIAGYKVTNIAPNSVKLVSGTNELELNVGEQLRREENGPWLLASQSASYAATLRVRPQRTPPPPRPRAASDTASGERGERHNQETDATTRKGIMPMKTIQLLPSNNLPVRRHSDPGRGTGARRSHQRSAQRAGHDYPNEHRSTAAGTGPGGRYQRGCHTRHAGPGVRSCHQHGHRHQRSYRY